MGIVSGFPPEIWAQIIDMLPGEQLMRLKATGAKVFWWQLRVPLTVKHVEWGEDYLILKRWPALFAEFSSLESLSFECTWGDWWQTSPLRLEYLPRTLRKLKIRFPNAYREPHLAAIFEPRGLSPVTMAEHLHILQDLDLNVQWRFENSWMHHLPSSLTILRCSVFYGDNFQFPDSLTHLEAQNVYRGPFPPSLTSMSGKTLVGLEWMLPLPPSLVSIKFDGIYPERWTYESEIFELLPTTLTELHGMCSWPQTVSRPIKFPKSIVRFSCQHLGYNYWEDLPPALEEFNVPKFDQHCTVRDHLPLDILPKSLTKLSLEFTEWIYFDLNFGSTSTATCAFPFPPFLTHLELRGAMLSPPAAKLLPASLRTLRISAMDQFSAKYLPKDLTDLHCDEALLTPALIKFLPKCLTTLYLGYADPGSNWIHPLDGNGLFVSQLMALKPAIHGLKLKEFWTNQFCLPSTLTKLILPSFDGLEDKFFHQNLANLTELDLPNSGWDLTNLAIPLLPSGLRSLRLPKACQITSGSFVDLPKGLTILTLGECVDIFDSEIQHLPRVLKVLCLPMALNLTQNCFPTLPDSLEYLDLAENLIISPGSVLLLPYRLKSTTRDLTFVTATWSLVKGKVKPKKESG